MPILTETELLARDAQRDLNADLNRRIRKWNTHL